MRGLTRTGLGFAFAISTMSFSAGIAAHEVSAHKTTVSAYVAAYNTRDLEAMRSMMHPQIEWIAVENGRSELVADGREALVEQMRGYFASGAETHSTFGAIIENGRFLTTRETAHWTTSDGTKKTQSSLVVYEFEDALVRRVWYYPAQ